MTGKEFNVILTKINWNFSLGIQKINNYILKIKKINRNSNDYTHIYGSKLSDVVRQHIKAQSAILDGEIIVLNKHTGQSEAFGANKSVAINQGETDLQLCCNK